MANVLGNVPVLARPRPSARAGVRRAAAWSALAWLLAAGSASALDVGRAGSFDGQTVMEVEVVGCVSTSPDQVRYRMTTKKGQPYNRREADGDHRRLVATNLFADVQINAPQPVPGGVKVVVRVRERGIVRRIEVRGSEQFKEKRVRKQIKTKIGERFDVGRANADRRAIEDDYHKNYYYFATCHYTTEPFEDGVRLVFNIDEAGGRVYIAEVNFRGNVAFGDRELRVKMQTRQTGWLTRGKYIRESFERDLENLRQFYRENGYLDAVVTERPFRIVVDERDTRWKRRDLYINIDIEEGAQYRVGTVDIEGADSASDEAVRRAIKTRPGAIFNEKQLYDDADAIRDIYGLYPNSRYFTQVDTDKSYPEAGAVINVAFSVKEGPEAKLTGIRIHGLKYTREEVVLREFELFPSQPIDSRKWNNTIRNIRRLGYFKDDMADPLDRHIKLVPDGGPDRGVAVLELTEQATGHLNFGLGYSSTDKLVGSVGLTQRNFDYRDMPKTWKDFFTGKAFRGGGQDFAIRLQRSSVGASYDLSYENPWIFGRPVSFLFNVFHTSYEYEDEYTEVRSGVQVGLGRRLFGIPDLRGSLSYRLEHVNLKDFEAEATPEMRQDGGKAWLNRWIANVTYDTRDNYIDPARGMLLAGTFELAGAPAGGDRDFWRAFLQGQFFMTMYEDKLQRPWVLALRADYRHAETYGDNTRIPLSERFHAGGVGSVRGFYSRTISPRDAYGNAIGGNQALVGGAEFFVPVYRDLLKASAFFDVGNVWTKQSNTQDEGWRTSWGLGLHVKTPLGPMPIRLYYAWTGGRRPEDDEQNFQFSLGAIFGN